MYFLAFLIVPDVLKGTTIASADPTFLITLKAAMRFCSPVDLTLTIPLLATLS